MGVLGGSRDSRSATPEELDQYADISLQLARLSKDGIYNPSDPNHRLMVIAFDATRSDRLDAKTGHTNPDILEQLVETNDRVSTFYVHGVGTRADTPLHSVYEMATGVGSEARAVQAYREFVTEVRDWHAQSPASEPHVITTGFSRGVGSQRHFANLLEDHGVPNSDCSGYLIAPGQVKQDLMFMFDGVVTGQEHVLDLPIPLSVATSVHLVAQEEGRAAFDLASTIDPLRPDQPGRLEFMVPGFHVDAGGDTQYGGLSARTLELAVESFKQNGVPMQPLPEQFQAQENSIQLTAPNRIMPFNWEFGDRDVDLFIDPDPGPKRDQERSLDQGCALSRS